MNAAEAADHLAGLEAEAHLLRGRIRTAADAGDLDETTRLYQRAGSLRLELQAVRMVVARVTRRERRHFGENTELNTAEHHLAELLATLGVHDESLRRVLG